MFVQKQNRIQTFTAPQANKVQKNQFKLYFTVSRKSKNNSYSHYPNRHAKIQNKQEFWPKQKYSKNSKMLKILLSEENGIKFKKNDKQKQSKKKKESEKMLQNKCFPANRCRGQNKKRSYNSLKKHGQVSENLMKTKGNKKSKNQQMQFLKTESSSIFYMTIPVSAFQNTSLL